MTLYGELHAHSGFSFLDGASDPEELVVAATQLGLSALALTDHHGLYGAVRFAEAARAFAEMTAQPIAPIHVAMQQAPVQQHIERGEAASLERLPALKQHALDPGRYLTASHAITIDPDSGVDNTAIQRSWIKGPRRMSWYPYPGTHNARNLRKWWAKGKPCPVAFWIGHHPAVSIGAQAKLGYGESHWGAAGALAGSALRLVPSLTHGQALMVPADAEVVIEGFAPPGVLEADGMVPVDNEDDADVVVLNTCCIRENADNKLYGSLGWLKQWKNSMFPTTCQKPAWTKIDVTRVSRMDGLSAFHGSRSNVTSAGVTPKRCNVAKENGGSCSACSSAIAPHSRRSSTPST